MVFSVIPLGVRFSSGSGGHFNIILIDKKRKTIERFEPYGVETLDAMLGKETTEGLFKLANNMIRVSNQPLAGRGGLSAPNIAIGLGLGAFLLNPLATLPAAAFYLGMSTVLRKPAILNLILAWKE